MNDCFIISNNVSDITQVEFLCLCSSLKILTLEGNPICTAPNALSSQEVGTKSIQQSASVYAALYKALVKKSLNIWIYSDNFKHYWTLLYTVTVQVVNTTCSKLLDCSTM